MGLSTSFKEFKKFALFVKSNQHLLQKINENYFQKYYQSAIPILNNLWEEAEKNHRTFVEQNFLHFMEQLIAGTAEEEMDRLFDTWKNNNRQIFPTKQTLAKAIMDLYDLRKRIILELLPFYTKQVKIATQLSLELSQLVEPLTAHAFQCYHSLREEGFVQENELFSSIIDHTVDGVLVVDSHLRILELNPVMCEMYQLQKKETLGKSLFEAFPFYKNTPIAAAIKEVFSGTLVCISERPFEKKTGFYELNLNPLYNQGRKVNAIVLMVHETTHRRKTEDSLKDANRQLQQKQKELQDLHYFQQQVMASVPSLIFLYDLQKNSVSYANEKIFNLLGYTPDEIKKLDGSIIGEIVRPNTDDAEVVGQDELSLYEPYKNLLPHEFLDTQLRAKHSNGSLRWLRTKSKVFKHDEKGKSTQILGIAEDITEKKEAQDKLIEAQGQLMKANAELERRVEERTARLSASEKQLHILTDALPVHIAYVDKHQKVRFINKASEDYLKKRKESVLGEQMWKVVGEENYLKIKPAIERACKGEKSHFEHQEVSTELKAVYYSIFFIPNVEQDEVLGFYCLAYDISELKETEQTAKKLYDEVRKKNKKLKRINIALDNFIYTASHDLRSPVINIEGLINLLREANVSRDNQDEKLYIEKLQDAAGKLKKTIDDLIMITKVQQEAEPKEVEKVYSPQIAREVKADLESLISESKAKIEEDYQVKEIKYARSHLRSILYNLLSNALKYRDPAKQLSISIKTSMKKKRVILEVADNGLGMTQEQQKYLFTMFRRMHSHVEGLGMGLFSVKRIIENNGGKIKIFSKPGEGSRFEVYL